MIRTFPHWRSGPRQASLSHRPVSAQGVLLPRWRHSCSAASFLRRSKAPARSGTILLVRGKIKHEGPGTDYTFDFDDPEGNRLQFFSDMDQIGWDGKSRPKEQWKRFEVDD
jgi:hypothetical protein